MTSVAEYHKFNDDLLLNHEDRDLAARRYPSIIHVLDHPELRQVFALYDKPANQAKSRARTAGLWAIGLIWAALAMASSENLLAESALARPLAVLSAICGLCGVIIGGGGVLFAGKKQEWLYRRLMTERIRQYHFQTFVSRLPEILRSLGGGEAKDKFLGERKAWLASFIARFEGKLDVEFAETLEDERGRSTWLHSVGNEQLEQVGHKELDPLFSAYRELRVVHQIGYATYKLKDDGRILSKSPRRQATILSTFGLICVVLVCALHVVVLLGVLSGPSVWVSISGLVSMAILWIAIAALAARAIEGGLQPERETERYQQYRSAVQFVLERFDHVSSQAEKVTIMQEMERLVFDEMRNFVIDGNRTKFVM